ncbi:hypothetical protein GH714_015777 [Hevea brasiliensis]|uniref:Uncharacterized protein n=1 Tax=Hevea brasiliensis TaxID=3981 RepID=A0A6A6LQB3_HEVBR|nr:hypothetical protein GH714_015777 [Hevea brasiliensis]
MASMPRTSSTAILGSRPFSSSIAKPSNASLSLTTGQVCGKNYYVGIGIQGKKGRFQFHVAVNNVATDVSFVEDGVYPFAALVGQDEVKLCLLLNVIDPKIGGVMIMDDRGTGKSSTVRSLNKP